VIATERRSVYIVLRRSTALDPPSGWQQATRINFVDRAAAERWIAHVSRRAENAVQFKAEEVEEDPPIYQAG
jgi:hypothetical protein